MKKTFITALVISLLLLATGCKMSAVSYNDAVVDKLDANATAIETTISTYNNIPDLVTEESEIDASEMRTTLEDAKITIKNSESIGTLESRNTDQQEAIRNEFSNYLERVNAYLLKYEEMVNYYENHSYKNDPNMVSEYDSELFDQDRLFDNFLETNNNLAKILKSYL